MADKDTKDTSADVKSFVNSLRTAANETNRLARATHKLEQSMGDASNAAIDKAATALEDLAKQSSILESAIKDEIKAHKQAPRELARTMDRLETYGNALIKAQDKYKRQLEDIEKAKAITSNINKLDSANDRKRRAQVRLAERALQKKIAEELGVMGSAAMDAAKNVTALATEAKKNSQVIQGLANDLNKPAAKIGKALEGMHSKVQTNISSLGEFSVVMALAKKAVSELYGQSIRLANKGLVGSMAQMNISAIKLRMSAEEFEGLVSANRDMIALMGGGAEGIANFEAILNESSVGLEYLGKEGKKAAATIMASFNKAGFGLMSANEDISTSYQANMKGLNKQFKLFNGIFGDTAEEFAKLYEQQLMSESLQAKLISGDTKDVNLQMKEIMIRTENLKLMGLNNDQINAMGKRADALFNPSKNRQGDAQTQRIAARQALMAGAQTVQGQDPELAATIADFVKSGAAEKYQGMSAQDKQTFEQQNINLFKSINKMKETIVTQRIKDRGDTSFKGLTFVERAEAAGNEFSNMDITGKDLNTAQAKGFNQTPEGIAAMKAKGYENTLSDPKGDTTALGKSFGILRDSVELTTAVLNNGFTTALAAAIAALYLFSGSLGKNAITSVLSKGLSGLKSLGTAAGLRSAGHVGVVGAASYGVGTIINDNFIEGTDFQDKLGEMLVKGMAFMGNSSAQETLRLKAGGRSSDIPSVTKTPNAIRNAKKPSQDITNAIVGASSKVGVDPGYMMATAAQESSFNPSATPGKGSAKGLYQFTNGTWSEMVKKYGQQYGIGMNDQFDPQKNALMGALFTRDNKDTLKSKGLSTDSTSLYAAHFLGAGGASTLLSARAQNPNASAAALMPKAAANNQDVFYNKDGSPKSVNDVYGFLNTKVGSQADSYNAMLSGKPTAPIIPPQSVTTAPATQPIATAQRAPQQQAGPEGNPVVSELQKHTNLLNTMVSLLGKPAARSSLKGFQIDQQSAINAGS